MKKIVFIVAFVLGISMNTFAQIGEGLFQYGEVNEKGEEHDNTAWYSLGQDSEFNSLFGLFRKGLPSLPDHGESGSQDAPVGNGILLIGFGAAYALRKRKANLMALDTGHSGVSSRKSK